MGTEYSNITSQTFIENRNSKFALNSPPFNSGQNSPNTYVLSDEESGYDIYGLMNSEQLEIAEKRHKHIILQQQNMIQQIESEQNKRIMDSLWKCQECKKNSKAFLFLPCRHLGLCIICNSQKLSKINKCCTCNQTIRQKIPINFGE